MTDNEILEYIKSWIHIVLRAFFYIFVVYHILFIAFYIICAVTDHEKYSFLFSKSDNFLIAMVVAFFLSIGYVSFYQDTWLPFKNKK